MVPHPMEPPQPVPSMVRPAEGQAPLLNRQPCALIPPADDPFRHSKRCRIPGDPRAAAARYRPRRRLGPGPWPAMVRLVIHYPPLLLAPFPSGHAMGTLIFVWLGSPSAAERQAHVQDGLRHDWCRPVVMRRHGVQSSVSRSRLRQRRRRQPGRRQRLAGGLCLGAGDRSTLPPVNYPHIFPAMVR